MGRRGAPERDLPLPVGGPSSATEREEVALAEQPKKVGVYDGAQAPAAAKGGMPSWLWIAIVVAVIAVIAALVL